MAQQRRGGFPADYLPWVRSLPALRGVGGAQGNASIDYLAKVPYRSIGRCRPRFTARCESAAPAGAGGHGRFLDLPWGADVAGRSPPIALQGIGVSGS